MSGLYDQTRWDATPHGRTPPTENILDSPTRCIEVNVAWAGFLSGMIERLAFYDVWDGDETTKETAINKIEEILLQLGTDCPAPGGAADYTLEQDIDITSDVASYNLTSLDTLAGRDLIIECLLAASDTGVRHLRVQANGLTTSIYNRATVQFQNATTYSTGTTSYIQIDRVLPQTATPQNEYGWVRMEFPRWKDTARYPLMHYSAIGQSRSGKGQLHIESAVDIQSLLLYASSGNIKAGSKIAVYTRG